MTNNLPATIEQRDEQVAALYQKLNPETTQAPSVSSHKGSQAHTDEEVLAKLHGEKSAKFKALWSGDTTGYKSQSEAEMALASKIAFYTQDEAQVIELMRQSDLMRDKWERRDYLPNTVRKVLNNKREIYLWPDSSYTIPWNGGAAFTKRRRGCHTTIKVEVG